MAGRGRPWRAWWPIVRFWWQHRGDPGFRWVHVSTAYGFWCDAHGAATMYTGGRGTDLDAQLTEAAQVIAQQHQRKYGG